MLIDKDLWEELDKISLQEQLLLEMAKIGNIRDLVLYVRTNDPGNYPHFHIVDEATLGRQFHCCVRIDCAQYFKPTGKEDTLNSKRRKELIEFLQSPSEDEPEKMNWKIVLVEWNRNNSTKKVSLDLQMPNYKELK